MRYSLFLSVVVAIMALFFAGCGKNSAPTGGSSTTGTLNIYLTDSPTIADFDSVNIIFTDVSAHLDSEWVNVMVDPLKVNLLDLNNGNAIIFGSSDVPAGKYTQIRIKIDSAYVVLAGQTDPTPMTVPSGAQTGLKLGPQFTVMEGATYELIVDFDVSRSVVETPQGYQLKPHLRVMPLALSGSISGTVTNPDNSPVAFAVQGMDTITTTIVSPVDGFLRLSFLPEGTYTVFILDNVNRSATKEGVLVVSELEKHVGNLELQ